MSLKNIAQKAKLKAKTNKKILKNNNLKKNFQFLFSITTIL